MSKKVYTKKASRAFKADRTEDYGWENDYQKREIAKERRNKNLRWEYECGSFE